MPRPRSRPRILLTRKWPSACEARLAGDYDVTLRQDDTQMTAAEIRAAMQSHDAVCATVTDPLGAEAFAGGTRARIVGNYGVGVNHIDLGAARAAGVAVTNTPDCLTEATADLAITLMLMVARRAGEGERELRAGGWTGWRPTHLVGRGLRGKVLGIVGMGRIGREVARIARDGFGMRVVWWNRSDVGMAGRMDSLAALMAAADVVSLHVPGGAETDAMIGMAELEALGPAGILINTARGTVVDEGALVAALRQGRIGGAGLDVYAREPRVPEDLRTREDVVLLPHLGSAVAEARVAMGMMVADALDAFFAGREVATRVA